MKEVKELISSEKIDHRIAELGAKITSEYKGEELVVICILKGSFMFLSDLVKKIKLPMTIEFMTVSSYGNEQESSGHVEVVYDLKTSLAGKNVLIVEDIVDSGLTLKTLMGRLSDHHPKSLKLASMLMKPTKLKHDVKVDYLGFSIEDKFVIGYGLDYAQQYRNLPYVGFFE